MLWMSERRKEFEEKINVELNKQLTDLENLQQRKLEVLEERMEQLELIPVIKESRKAKEQRDIKRIFDEYITWVEETMTTEDNPYIKVIAVIRAAT